MSSDQWDAQEIVRIRLRHAEEGAESWSRRLHRHEAERDVAMGSDHLSLAHAKGRPVVSAAIVAWTFD